MEPRPRLLAGLYVATAVTGLVDAASVLALGHVFVANMTGNIVFLGFSAADRTNASLSGSLVALAAFLVGALSGGRARDLRNPWRVDVVLVTIAAIACRFPAPHAALIALLAMAMGLRTACVRRLGIPDLTTTVLTLTLTGLAADSGLAHGTNPRWRRRVASVFLMLAGAFSGAWLLGHVDLATLVALIAVGEAVATALVLPALPADTGTSRSGIAAPRSGAQTP